MAAGANGDDKREKDNDTYRLIEPVLPQMRVAAKSRDPKHRQDHQAANAERSFDVNQPAHPAQENTGEEWIQQPCKPDMQLFRIQCPAADHIPLAAPDCELYQETRGEENKNTQQNLRKPP